MSYKLPFPIRQVYMRQIDPLAEADPRYAQSDQVIAALRQVDLFAVLDDAELRQLAEHAHVRLYGAGEVLTRQGDDDTAFFIIRSGQVRGDVAGDGNGGSPVTVNHMQGAMLVQTSDSVEYPFDFAGHRFLVTGGAGFIGSHIVRRLVALGSRVRVLDLLTTGRRENLADMADRIEFVQADVGDLQAVRVAMDRVDYALHLAALVSVPESVEHPERNLAVNLVGTHNVLLAARDAQVRRVVFSSTCAVYGDHRPPHHEGLNPRALSPYAAAKLGGEQLCRSFAHVYGLPAVCLRYFNVFGPGQNPSGGYAAAIPRFIMALLSGEPPQLYGDGYQSRDFVYVADVVAANLLACGADAAIGGVFNIGTGRETSLLELLSILSDLSGQAIRPSFGPARSGDIRHSLGDIARATQVLGYRPSTSLADGLRETLEWYRVQAIG